MNVKAWLQSLRKSFNTSRRASLAVKPQMGSEVLEDRALLATFTVSNLDDLGAGSLRQAIEDANAAAGDDIIDATGVTGTITLDSPLTITDGVALNGPGADQLSVSGGDAVRVLNIDDGTAGLINVSISDVTIREGMGPGFLSGGILSRENTTLHRITVADNITTNGGGGLDHTNGTLVIDGSTFSWNSGNQGGAIKILSGTVAITNTTFSDNSATGAGGGIAVVAGDVIIRNSTFTDNRGNGGGIFANNATTTLHNTIVAGNFQGDGTTVNDVGGTFEAASSSNLIGDAATAGGLIHGTNGNIVGNAGSGTITTSTVLDASLTDNGGSTQTHALTTDSPAIDAGNNALALNADGNALTTDQRGSGFSRVLDGDIDGTATVDIGAFEVPKVSRLIVVESDNATSVSESVGVDSFTIELNFQPASDVVVQLAGVDVSEFVLNQTTVTFTSENWNVPQTIEVMGIDDRELDGDTTTMLTVAVDVENSDAEFSATAAHELTVTTTDNDATSTTGQSQSFNNHAPTQVVNYTIALTGVFPSPDGGLDDFDPVIGQVGIFGFNFAPAGSAFADGQILNISDHTALFSVLGTTYGGDGETTFSLPDLRGRVPIGADPANGIPVGAELGSTDVTLTEANLPSHTHALTGSSVTFESTGDDQSFDNQQPALALTPIIARQGIFDGLGEVVWFAGNFVPDQELPADGSLLPISSNTALFSMLGTTYGGDGETTFGLPDLRGRAAIGAGGGPELSTRNMGQQIGEVNTFVTAANLPAHAHQLEETTVESTGAGTPLNNLHPATTLRYLVALVGVFPSGNGGGAPGRAIGGNPTLGQIALTSAAGQIPDGFASADGQSLDIANNSALFSLYGTTYGGDGQTTFGLPDLRGRLAAHDDSAHALGAKHGAESITLTEATTLAHEHVVIPPQEYVVTTAVDEIDFANNDVSLREAIISANYHSGPQDITFAAALSGTTIELLAGQLELTSDVTITGPGMAVDLIIDAQQNSRVFHINADATAALIGLTVTNGNAENNVERDFGGSLGGGILNALGTLTLNDVRVTNSTATYGAGINNYGAGGSASINIVNSTISNNIATYQAGGLYNWGHLGAAVANVAGSTFNGNTAEEAGGAILNWAVTAELNVTNSTFVANMALEDGGALLNTQGVANLTNSTLVGNVAEHGGAIADLIGQLTLNNSIVAGNGEDESNPSDVDGTLVATSANNLIGDADSAGGLTDGTNNNIVGGSWKTVFANDGTVPILEDHGGKTQTVALLNDSSAIDAGSNALAIDSDDNTLTTDQRGSGFNRINDGDANGTATVDIGAFEFIPVELTVAIVEDSISENAGIGSGTVTRTGNTADALVVMLSSDDTSEAAVPLSVTIAVGQLTSPAFTITGVDDVIVDGVQTATITASATNVISGSDSIELTDDDTASLTLAIAENTFMESAGAVATTATVSRNTDTTEELIISLASSDDSEATVPATITIAAGEFTSAEFQIAAVDDTDVDGTQAVTITASATDFADSTGFVQVTDDDSAHGGRGNVDGDGDFDANDAFLIQLIQLAGSDTQIDQTKGVSLLTASEIRAIVAAIGLAGDVDGDGDFDANDSFLIQLVKLAGSNTQIDQTKGASPLTAVQIRNNVDSLSGDASGQRSRASVLPRLAAVYAGPNTHKTDLFESSMQRTVDYPPASADVSESNEVWEDFRSWIDAL